MHSFIVASEETEQLRDLGVEPWVIGLIALSILIVLLLALLSFGKGREHS
ncbi:hypothetical protein [Aeromicrobium stalagmiti]|nr:hypothetical protein [Aeromicrobium stalagmiti]NRQ51249.1 hypothetical protein [Aeromicrobium stalagmiti]